MTTRATLRTIALACLLLAAGFVVDDTLAPRLLAGLVTHDAQARLGRPASPTSVAGVARRRIRRSTILVVTLPRSCTRVVIEGTVLMHCGGTYYQAYGNQYVVMYVD